MEKEKGRQGRESERGGTEGRKQERMKIKRRALIYSICQFPWCKFSQNDQSHLLK